MITIAIYPFSIDLCEINFQVKKWKAREFLFKKLCIYSDKMIFCSHARISAMAEIFVVY